jgi:hypothetical protein
MPAIEGICGTGAIRQFRRAVAWPRLVYIRSTRRINQKCSIRSRPDGPRHQRMRRSARTVERAGLAGSISF